MSELWTKWEGEVIEGRFPLERCIGSSDHSGVFLTEHTGQNSSRAALKVVPAIPTLAEWQLAHWNVALSLSHPHLIRLLRAGRCRLGTHDYLYVVMEYADQNLSQLLAHRALTEEEARELLLPALDALSFLHRRNLVQGQLKPSNILAVGDNLKFASDTIRPAGEATASIGRSSVYDPPESKDGSSSTAGDVWALGVTLLESLTRAHPSARVERREEVVLPPHFPPSYAEIVRKCLSYDATDRPSVADLVTWTRRGVSERGAPGPTDVNAIRLEPAPSDASDRLVAQAALDSEARAHAQASRRGRSFALPILAAVAIVLVCWTAARVFIHPKLSAPATSESRASARPVASLPDAVENPLETARPLQQKTESAQPVSPAPDTKAADLNAGATPLVLHEEIPKVPRTARATIHGHVKVVVRVTVDSSGKVVGEALAEPGPSRYFARLATNAARKWRFSRVDDRSSRRLLVRFVFSRGGTTGHAAALRSG